jgi:NADH:ubiquinone reductase (H+-translocating)
MKRIVIVGAGFAGLAAAKAVRHSDAEVLVVDRANHNLFQPLLYQVATTVLSPAQIASPIRGLLQKQRNTTVILGEVGGVNKDAKCLYVSNQARRMFPFAMTSWLWLLGSRTVTLATMNSQSSRPA